MSIIKYLTVIFLTTFFLTQKTLSEEVKKVGKFKDWETIVVKSEGELLCFAQTKPLNSKQALDPS